MKTSPAGMSPPGTLPAATRIRVGGPQGDALGKPLETMGRKARSYGAFQRYARPVARQTVGNYGTQSQKLRRQRAWRYARPATGPLCIRKNSKERKNLMKKIGKRTLALFIAVLLCVSLMPMSAMAVLDTGHSVKGTFVALYVDSSGNRAGSGSSISENFTCSYTVKHSDTAYNNHTISYDEMRQKAAKVAPNGASVKGWTKSDPGLNGKKVTYYSFKYSGSESLNKGGYMYFIFDAPHTHSYSWVQTKAPTCYSKGTETYKCSCGATNGTRDIAINPNAHTYPSTWTDNGDGRHVKHCSNNVSAHDLYEDHTYGAWVTTKEPQVGVTGEKQHTCTACGHVETQPIEALAPKTSVQTVTLGVQFSKDTQAGSTVMPTLENIPTDFTLEYSYTDADGKEYTGTLRADDAEVKKFLDSDNDDCPTLQWVNSPLSVKVAQGSPVYITLKESNYTLVGVDADNFIWTYSYSTDGGKMEEGTGKVKVTYASWDKNTKAYGYNYYKQPEVPKITVTWMDGYTDTPMKTEKVDKDISDTYLKELYPADPIRDGFTFTVWGTPVTDLTTGDITITAQWKCNHQAPPETIDDPDKDPDTAPPAPDGWSIKAYTDKPTCTQTGSITYQCNNCGEEATVTIKALGHLWPEKWSDSHANGQTCDADHDNQHIMDCLRNCGEEGHHKAESHSYTTAEVTENLEPGVEKKVIHTCTCGHEWAEEVMKGTYTVTWKDNPAEFPESTSSYADAHPYKGDDIPAYPYAENPTKVGYLFVDWAEPVPEGDAGDQVIYAVWEPDTVVDPTVPEENRPGTGGDGIPDKYQVTVKYVSSDSTKGTVTADDKVFTLKDSEDRYAETGTIKPGTVGVTVQANEKYEANGWDVDPDAELQAKGGKTYTYTAQWKDKEQPVIPDNPNPPTPVDPTPVNPNPPTPTIRYTVNWEDGSGNIIKTTTTTSTDVPDSLYPADPEREGESFTGWGEPEISGTVITIIAQWDEEIDEPDVPLIVAPGLDAVNHFAYIIGYGDGTVRPGRNITRAEVATIFYRLMTDDYRGTFWSQNNDFTDVNSGDWFNNAVSTSAEAELVKGYADGTFKGKNNITRAEFATIAARFLSDDPTGENPFTDTQGHWAEKDILKAYEAGWINGYADGTFKPNAKITRAEVMTIVNRMLNRVPHAEDLLDGEMTTYPDNQPGAWYYAAVQEATNSHDYEMGERDGETVETWTAMLPNRDWAALEKEWSNAYSGSDGNDVM